MKKLVLLSSLLALLLVTSRAGGQDVRYNFDRQTDFSKYKTYKWVEIKGAEKVSDLADKQIKGSVDAELARKGLTKVENGNADLYIAYQPALSKEKEFTSYSTGWGYGPGWGGWYGGGWYGGGTAMTTGQTSTIYIGQLAIDMYDAGKQSLVWRGVVSKTLDPKAKPEKQQKNLDKAIAKLLKNYPPDKK